MAPDMQILEMFTTADDSMQGLWGLHRYVQAAHETANRDRIMERIPEGSFQMTHEWLRYYDRQELVIAVAILQPTLLFALMKIFCSDQAKALADSRDCLKPRRCFAAQQTIPFYPLALCCVVIAFVGTKEL